MSSPDFEGWGDKTLPQLLVNREFERRPDYGVMVAREGFELSAMQKYGFREASHWT